METTSLTVYMLLCADDKIYVGVTNNLELRIAQHNQGEDRKAFTYKRRPVKHLWSSTFGNKIDAITAEKQLKGWTRVKKLALAAGNYEALHLLSKKQF